MHLVSVFVFCFASSFSLSAGPFFRLHGIHCGGVRMAAFVLHTREARDPTICEIWGIFLCVSFLDFVLPFYLLLPCVRLKLYSLFPFGCVIFKILISIFRRRVVIFVLLSDLFS